eukprot:39881-Amphidinium_carterae.2
MSKDVSDSEYIDYKYIDYEYIDHEQHPITKYNIEQMKQSSDYFLATTRSTQHYLRNLPSWIQLVRATLSI